MVYEPITVCFLKLSYNIKMHANDISASVKDMQIPNYKSILYMSYVILRYIHLSYVKDVCAKSQDDLRKRQKKKNLK